MESKNIRYYLDTTKVQRHETLAGTIVLVSIIEFQNDDFETILSKIYFVTTKLLLRAKEPSRSIYPEILNIDMWVSGDQQQKENPTSYHLHQT